MRYLPLEEIEEGMFLARSIFGEDGRILLTKGTKLSKGYLEKLKAMNTALRLRLRPNTAKRPQATIATQRHLCLPIGGEAQEQERRPADCRYPTGWLAVMGEPPTT